MSSAVASSSLDVALVHLNAGLYFEIAAFPSSCLTLSSQTELQVERIWKQKITGASILFFLNRYLTPLQFIIITDAFQDPRWTKKACDHFVVFEGASTVALIAICELIMILRVYALYGRSTLVIVPLLCILAVQIALSSVGLHNGFAVPLPPGVTGCILTGTSSLLVAIWVTPLITDTCIFILTLWKTRQYIVDSGRSPTLDMFLRDGIMYFFVIFGVNLLNTLVYLLAPADLKAIGASFSQLMTSVMISRLFLNLRSVSESTLTNSRWRGIPFFRKSHSSRPSENSNTFLTMTIGNLGEDFQFSQDSASDG